MSKLYNSYLKLKEKDSSIIYIFKIGIFYIAIDKDAQFLSEHFNLKLTNLNETIYKCDFPYSSFDKYYLLFFKKNLSFKIIEGNDIFTPSEYLTSRKTQNIIDIINNIEIDNLSISEAYSIIENLKKLAHEISIK